MDKSDFNTPRNTTASVKPLKFFSTIMMLFIFIGNINAQCPNTDRYNIGSDINWTEIPGIGTCSSSLTNIGSTFNGNVNISYLGSNNDLTFNVNNLTINGNLNIQSSSNGNKFIIAPNTTLTIIGDLGDPSNNNISYELGIGSVLIVTGTLYGKNTNTIGGSGGTVSAGSVNFTGALNCSTVGCPVLNITNCQNSGSVCNTNNSNTNLCTTNNGGSISGNQFGCSSFDPTVLNLIGSNGTILRWEKSINNSSTWTGLNSVSTTYDPPLITQTTNYRAVILNTTAGSCISYSNTATVTVSPTTAPATPTISTIAATCLAAGTSTISNYSVSNTYTFSPTGPSVGALGVISSMTVGTSYTVTANNGSCTSSASSSFSNAAMLTTPLAPTINSTAATCLAAGTSTISNYSGSNNYTFTPTGPSVGALGVISSMTVGTSYTVTANNGSCTSSASSSFSINPLVTKTWKGTPSPSWFKDDVLTVDAPTINDRVIIDENYSASTNGDLNAGCLTINKGTLTIEPGKNVTIQNDLTIKDGATLEVLDQGSLRMVEDSGKVTNIGTGKTEVHRVTSPFEKYDYVYWSTPVENTTISSAINTPFQSWRTNHAYEYKPGNFLDNNVDGYDDDGNDWSFVNTMNPGKGYIVMVPDPPTSSTPGGNENAVADVLFSGKVNNGVVTTPIELTTNGFDDDDFNLVGNPYPSAISADKFILSNISTNGGTIDGTLYFWTHAGDISANNPGISALNYSADDYAVYTLAGGTATSGSKIGTVEQSNKPLGFIASGQGFFVEAYKAGTLLFNNAMRVGPEFGTETKNNQFYKLQSNKKQATTAKDRIWLNLQNNSKMFSQQLIGYFDNATLGYDNGYDGLLSDAGNYVNFYSFIDNDTYKIQGRSSFDQNDEVRLGYFSAVAGTFNINIDSKEGVFANTNQAVYLEDKVTNTVTNLKTGDYTFTTEVGTFDDRFVLRYTDKTLGLNETDQADGILVFYSNNYKTLIIKNNVMDATVNSVVLFNTTGQRIANFDIKDSGQTNLQIPIKNIASGIYIVKVKTTKGESSKKVIVN